MVENSFAPETPEEISDTTVSTVWIGSIKAESISDGIDRFIVGERYETDSKLGWTFDVKYLGTYDPETNRYGFQNTSPGWTSQEYTLLSSDVMPSAEAANRRWSEYMKSFSQFQKK